MKISKHCYLVFLVFSLSACWQSMHHTSSFSNKIQDTERASNYFENELNFTVYPVNLHGVIANKNQRFTIIDVRKVADYNAGHIPGAINLPCDQWDYFEGKQLEFPGLIRNGFNYVYCYALLCDLSLKAAKKFASLGYPVKEIKGGAQSWKKHGYTFEK